MALNQIEKLQISHRVAGVAPSLQRHRGEHRNVSISLKICTHARTKYPCVENFDVYRQTTLRAGHHLACGKLCPVEVNCTSRKQETSVISGFTAAETAGTLKKVDLQHSIFHSTRD